MAQHALADLDGALDRPLVIRHVVDHVRDGGLAMVGLGDQSQRLHVVGVRGELPFAGGDGAIELRSALNRVGRPAARC